MFTIFRLIIGTNPINLGGAAPVGNSFTGFWTTNKNHIYNMIKEHNQYVEDYLGGGSLWPDELTVLTTTIDNVETLANYKEMKTNHVARFDDNEIFVKKILDHKKVKIQNWKSFINDEDALTDGQEFLNKNIGLAFKHKIENIVKYSDIFYSLVTHYINLS